MFVVMFLGKFELKFVEDGVFFIDCDGIYFWFIFNFFCIGILILLEDVIVFEEVMKEVNFYQIQELVDVFECLYDLMQFFIFGLKVVELFGELMIVIIEEY